MSSTLNSTLYHLLCCLFYRLLCRSFYHLICPLTLPLGLSLILPLDLSLTLPLAPLLTLPLALSAHSVSSQGGLVEGENCRKHDQPHAELTKEHSLPRVRARRKPSECDIRSDSRRATQRFPKDRVIHLRCFCCHCMAHFISLRTPPSLCRYDCYCHFTLIIAVIVLCALLSLESSVRYEM